MTPRRAPRPEGPPGPDREQIDLVDALRAGDALAYTALIRRHGRRLLHAARRLLGSEEDARDCVQETFVQAFRRIGAFEGRADLGTWLHRIAINQALMKLRSRSRHPEASIEELLPEFDRFGCRIEPVWQWSETVDEMLARRQTRELVVDKIAALPEDYRIVLMLRDVEEYDTREVADLLGVSTNVVKVRLHRARAALKRLLEPLFAEARP